MKKIIFSVLAVLAMGMVSSCCEHKTTIDEDTTVENLTDTTAVSDTTTEDFVK